ncbi:hypothetical protein PR003_g23278 [Phytophthora rubi]|uniref:Uncharacterized protein n=1 Tax=Phytophthora rubi TaxID=129364 RepID=A0A6A4D0L7_9STRA|nr:hypothetical protein PR002_g2450 [Phytophthora rubi]KAE9298291.1 hypothetical protein PR003_g23278 [Phytophthora rubi]
MGSQRATRPRRGPWGVTEEVTAREEETQKTTDAAVETQETAARPGNTHELSDRELNGDFCLWQYRQVEEKSQPPQEPTSVKTKMMSRRRKFHSSLGESRMMNNRLRGG